MPLRVPLLRHPDGDSPIRTIEVEVLRRGPRRLDLAFFMIGRLADVRRDAGVARDELWKSTCFEAFVRAAGEEAYYEINMAPSGRWMAFRFDGRREGRTDADTKVAAVGGWIGGERKPILEPDRGRWADAKTQGWTEIAIDFDRARDLPLDRPWRLGVSAVIEEKNGRKSYWALAHPPGAPDFHNPDSFALELPPAPGAKPL